MITPNPCLAGERVSIVTNTKGYGEIVIVDLNSIELGRTITLSPDFATTNDENVFRGTYIVPLGTKDGTYDVPATVYRTTAFGVKSETTTLQLIVKGNMFQLIKPRIRDSN